MIPVILSGGSGTRLWPVSRESYPKQFCEFFDRSFLKETILRLQPFGVPRVLTLQSMKVLTENTYKDLSLPIENIIYEPMGRNTAPAVALLCHHLMSKGQGAEVVGVFPADHLVQKTDEFRKVIQLAEQAARQKKIVTLGLTPSYAATGYGYIELKGQAAAILKAEEVVSFHEKPSADKAESYLQSGNFYWNAGIFLFQVEHMVSLFEKHLPDVWRQIQQIKSDGSNLSYIYANIDGISLDYAILEKTKDILCVPCDLGWSDVGSWDEMARLSEGSLKSAQSSRAQVFLQDAENNYVYSQSNKVIALSDVNQLIVVDTPDALLIGRRGQSQNVSRLVKGLQAEGIIEAPNRSPKNGVVSEFNSETLDFSIAPSTLDSNGISHAFKKLQAREDLGFLKSPLRNEAWGQATEYATQLKKKFSRLVVVGLGGSQLGGQTLIETLIRNQSTQSPVEFWGEIDPIFIGERLATLKNQGQVTKTHFIFISKSGRTLELATILNLLSAELKKLGGDLLEQCSVITEKRSNPLYNWAQENKIHTLEHPQDVGGRFSAFTLVGLVPAAFAGVNLKEVQSGALWALKQTELINLMSAHFARSFELGKSITVFWSYAHPLATFQKWLEQLWAESLGQSLSRQGSPAPKVSTPFMAAGVSAQHSVLQQFMEGAKDKSFVFLRYKKATSAHSFKMDQSLMKEFSYLKNQTCFDVFEAESKAVQKALDSSGALTSALEVNQVDDFSLGALMMSFQLIIGTLGEYLDINAYDQPGVELGKKLAIAKLNSGAQ
jgi:mannose-1-phosphate guanylyltransferase/mannose-6-phosphate isomerase